ncbi:MAG: P1 family peptidase [Treponema sp.]|nr:P1 family peptidase [Treponema sp.]MBR4386570.1 P1 family peptidase [Treponema sp.]
MNLKEISIKDIGGFRIGNAQNYDAMTGVTAIVFDRENTAGIDISGGGPAARESYLFTPLAYKQSITALLLSGGSAYGLAAATGAMQYLEEHRMGYRLMDMVIPIVPQSCIFDLSTKTKVRPDAKMGYDACQNAELDALPKSGNVGGGCGASVGKICGLKRAQKSGIGYYALQVGHLKVGAVVIVNALGDVFDFRSGKKVAGAMNAERTAFMDSEEELYSMQNKIQQKLTEGTNTTIGAIITNASFSQQEMCKIAAMSRSGLARSINPVGTSADGDTVYAVSCGGVKSDCNLVGTLASRVLSMAILDAVTSSKMTEEEYARFLQIKGELSC